MDMTRLLMRRSVLVSLVCLVVVLALAVARAQLDIQREGQGADQVARLFGELAALQSADALDLEGQIDRLRAIAGAGRLRHLDFRLEDEAGRVLIPASETKARPDDAPTVETQLLLQRSDGMRFRASLIPNPASERAEALSNIVGMAGLFLAYALAMLVALYAAVRYAFRPLRGIVAAIADFRRGNFGVRLPRLPVYELDEIAAALNHMAEALTAAEARQKRLSLQLLTLQEDERARVAIDLQERCGQSLTAFRANVAYLLRKTECDPTLYAVAVEMEAQSASLHQSIHALQRQLQPAAEGQESHGMDMLPQLHELLKSWQDARGHSVHYQLQVDPLDLRLPRELGLTLYRMTQEALTNIARHADARQVNIVLQLADAAPWQLNWEVSDDGIGIASPEAALGHGNGLACIRERVWAHGGCLELEPMSASRGLRLRARLPYRESVAP